jgi:DNA-binding NarL/FixJ family response regulator
MQIRILIAHGFPLARKNLRLRLLENPDYLICGEATDGQDAVLQARALNPDLIILDLALPVLSGFEAGRQILRDSAEARIFLYSLFGADCLEEAAAQAGFCGVFVRGEEGKLSRAIDSLWAAAREFIPQPNQKLYPPSLPAY